MYNIYTLPLRERAEDIKQLIKNILLRLNKLYNSILPLLSNLKANPEKDYIYWPKRTEKVEAFEDLIAEIVK